VAEPTPQWIPPGALERDSCIAAAFIGVLAAFGTLVFGLRILGTNLASIAGTTGIAIAFGAAAGAGLRFWLLPPTIAVDEKGLYIRGSRRIAAIPWTDVHPYLERSIQPRNLIVEYQDPAWKFKSRMMARIVLYPDQARRLLLHPSAPRWKGDPEMLRKWGIPI
jgi:hypothetical protein